ncbi:MAG: hypothetical protein PHE53_14275, partial [Thermoguttaceae bacterium]|nr:hypothetical protein [Thermoguttaceae bacterium]
DSNNQPIGYEYDMVTVNIQDNSTTGISDWVIPSGWTINGTSFTTPKPVNAAQTNVVMTTKPTLQSQYTAGAIGPQNEGSNNLLAGSSASANMKKGDAFIPWTPTNGFTLEFDYSFDQCNGDNGYVRPDNGGGSGALSEKYDAKDSYKASFVANSGIKIFGVYEIQIFDTYQMVERIKQQLCIKHEITTNDEGFDALLSNELKAIMNGTSSLGYQSENSKGTLVNGIPYGYSAVNEDDNVSVQRIFDAATATVSGTGSMRIVYNPYDSNYENQSTVAVSINNANFVTYLGYPNASTIPLVNASNDPNIYIQSHWGSGVTFSNVSISYYYE